MGKDHDKQNAYLVFSLGQMVVVPRTTMKQRQRMGGTRVARDRLPTLNRLVGDGFNGKVGF